MPTFARYFGNALALLLDAVNACRPHRSWPVANAWSLRRRRRRLDALAAIQRRTGRLLRIAHLRGNRPQPPA